MDRRAFLGLAGGALAGGALAGGAIVLGGCGSKSDLVLIPNDWDFFTGGAYRVSLLLASTRDNGAPIDLTSPVTLRVGGTKGPLGGPIHMVIHHDGPQPAYALTSYRFPSAGVYRFQATYKGNSVSLPISVTDPSTSAVPVIGAGMPRLATPTTAAPLGMAKVCTAQPACPFHTVSLDAALAASKPVALLFATPAFCQTKFCGPVLDNLVSVAGPWMDRVTFIHCEIYRDDAGSVESAPVQALQLEHEPMLYLVGTDGVIVNRLDNLFDKGEARDALRAAFG